MNSNVKTIIFWLVLVCIAVLLWAVVRNNHNKPDRALNFSEFLTEVESGNIRDVTINGNEVKGEFMNGQNAFHTIVEGFPVGRNGVTKLQRKYARFGGICRV